jgi:hypothetical protein
VKKGLSDRVQTPTFYTTVLVAPCEASGSSSEYLYKWIRIEASDEVFAVSGFQVTRIDDCESRSTSHSYSDRDEEIMISQDHGIREITQWWDEFCRSTDTRQELLETAIGKEVRRRIFEVHVSDEVVCLFEKLDTVLEFYFSLAKKVRSTEMWRLMLFWSLQSVILWADYTELESELEELDGISTGDPPEPASTYH